MTPHCIQPDVPDRLLDFLKVRRFPGVSLNRRTRTHERSSPLAPRETLKPFIRCLIVFGDTVYVCDRNARSTALKFTRALAAISAILCVSIDPCFPSFPRTSHCIKERVLRDT